MTFKHDDEGGESPLAKEENEMKNLTSREEISCGGTCMNVQPHSCKPDGSTTGVSQ